MKPIVVLAMHGSPPKDFPRDEFTELFKLHGQLTHMVGPARESLQQRHDELDAKMRSWPRTPENDPFHTASHAMARHLGEVTGYEVVVGFNEFCAPTVEVALDQAAARGALVVVATPMLTQGGEHAEEEIPTLIEQARERHPDTSFIYAWPFELAAIAAFLAAQIERVVPDRPLKSMETVRNP